MSSTYHEVWQRSIDDREAFWLEQARLIDWYEPPTTALDATNPPFYRWFPGGRLNTCFNALDRHVRDGHGDRLALIYDSPMTGSVVRYTYDELLRAVADLAGGLVSLGVRPGDRVLLYLPMIPEAVMAMLACARIGAIHSVVFGGFAAPELAARIDDAEPRVVLTASCGLEPSRIVEYKPLLDRALELASHRPDTVVVKQRPQHPVDLHEGELDWEGLVASGARTPAEPVAVASTDPLYVLYTSGTTGRPKGIVRDNGGHAVALTWSMGAIFDIHPGQVMFAASDVGWVVGHSYIVYAPLLAGATTVLFEGKPVGTPDASTYWRIVEQHRVEVMFTAPTAIRAIKKEDPEGRLMAGRDLSSLRTLFLAGERLDPDTYEWARKRLGVDVVDNWWQTETGWPIAANLRGLAPLPVKPGSPSVPVPGYVVRVLDQSGNEVPRGVEGAICIKLPLPPGTLPTLWRDDQRFVDSYLSAYPGHYFTGDSGYFDEDGYLYVMGRMDDVINVAGHRLSTGAIEAALAQHPAVAECAVVGTQDALKGQVPSGFVVLKKGIDIDESTLRRELVDLVRATIGPVAAFQNVQVVDALPKTRSGKILRRTIREIADGGTPAVPSTIEDAGVLDRLRATLHGSP